MVNYEQDFISSVKQNYPKHCDKILEAYAFASKMHEGVKRKSGEPYIIHPLCVAKILIENNMDYSTLIAGLLHDVVEDTEVTSQEIKNRFGETVARLVDGVTKIDEFTCSKYNLTEADSIKHLLLAMGNDVRVIFIKLADRLHNMRTIQFLKREKQLKMAEETQELFIPIAERIGVRKLRTELQDLTFKCMYPEEYNKIKAEFDRKFSKRKDKIEKIEKTLADILTDHQIENEIVAWPEQYFSIFKRRKYNGIGKIYNFMLIKVIVPTEQDCYRALGLFHKKYRPVPGQFKDHIAVPKKNGYQSIHSVMVSEDSDITFKVMIRTAKMDKTCEYGVSAMWQNKDSDFEFDENFEKKNNLKDIIFGEEDLSSSSVSFIDAIKTDLLPDVTWVLTPKLKPICVSANSPTVIDFAYAVHTSIGNSAIGAVVNGKKVSVTHTLSHGDVVEVLLSKTPKAPSRKWLFIAKTSYARKKMREFNSKHTTPENILAGKEMLVKEFSKKKISKVDLEQTFKNICKEFAFTSVDDMLASIGYGGVNINQIVSMIDTKTEEENSKLPIIVPEEYEKIKLNLSKCCCPIFGDEIVGVKTKNSIAVHTANCSNLNAINQDRLVELKWKKSSKMLFDVNLKVTATDKHKLAATILGFISDNDFDISKIVAKKVNSMLCEFNIVLGVKDVNEINSLMEKLKTIPEVRTVSRYFD